MSTSSQSDVNSHLSPPPKDLGNELVLLASSSDVPGLVLQPADVSASSRGKPIALDEVAHNHRGGTNVAVHLPWLGQVGDTGVRAHQHVHRVETSLEEPGGEQKIRLKIVTGLAPTTNLFFVSERWIPPRGVFGRWLWGTSARQYKPTLWIESTACNAQGEVGNDNYNVRTTDHSKFEKIG